MYQIWHRVEIVGYNEGVEASNLTFPYIFEGGLMLERFYQRQLIRELKLRFPGCVVIKNDPTYIQGFPDLLVLHHDMWAALEVKAHSDSYEQPNQEHWVGVLGTMSFAAFIYPENEAEVLHALQRAFEHRRPTRIPLRE